MYAWKIYSMIKIKMRIRLSYTRTNSIKLELRSVIRKLPASESKSEDPSSFALEKEEQAERPVGKWDAGPQRSPGA